MKIIDLGTTTQDGLLWGIFTDVGIWGPMIYGGVLIGLFLIFLFFIIFFTARRRQWARSQAKSMLEKNQIDPNTIEKTLKILGGRTKDAEAQSMFRKLYEMVDQE
jgi:cbb3-type cytochrome oxidase subunit 3